MDPFDAEKEAAALERRLGVIAENFAAKLAEWRDLNYALRENPDVPASITVESPATLVLDGGDVAEMQICEVDPWMVVELGAGPNGSDAIVNDEVSAYRRRFFMRLIDGTWRFEGGIEIERVGGSDRRARPNSACVVAAWLCLAPLQQVRRRRTAMSADPHGGCTPVIDGDTVSVECVDPAPQAGSSAEWGDGASAALSLGGGDRGGWVGSGGVRRHHGVGVHLRHERRRWGRPHLSRRAHRAGLRT